MDAVFGPSQDFQVPAMISGSGVLSQTGEKLSVLVVDCPEEVANHLREFQEGEEIVYSYDEDAPFSFPSIDALLPLVRAWAVATSDQLAAFYTRLHTRGRGRPRIIDTRTCNASCPKKASHKGYSYRRWTKAQARHDSKPVNPIAAGDGGAASVDSTNAGPGRQTDDLRGSASYFGKVCSSSGGSTTWSGFGLASPPYVGASQSSAPPI